MRYEKHITRQMLRDNPETLFVFGDNMLERGLGGQAAEMRGEPNAVGIPTKYMPGMGQADFFIDDDIRKARPKIDAAFTKLLEHAAKGGEIVWPKDGIGTGLAELPKRAPKIWALIEYNREALDRVTA
jgi:hypothetical protein